MAKKTASVSNQATTPHLQAVRNNRLLAGLLFLLFVAAIASQFGWAYMYTHKAPTKEPVFIEYVNGTNNFVRISRAGEEITARAAMADASMKRYVIDREGVDGITETVRYPRVMSMSSKEVGGLFKREYMINNPKYKRKGYKRTVDIQRSGKLDEGVYQVEFKLTDSQNGIKEDPHYYVANFAYSLQDQMITYDETDMNPLGLYVEKYAITERRN